MPVYNFYFLNYPETKLLFGIFNKYNIEARFVGGCVRDCLLGVKTQDLDLAIDHDILKTQNILIKNGAKCIPTGIKYGSITVFINSRKFEITSLRKDEECFGRDCVVASSSSFEEDARRRDFTMNALYVSKNGELFDYFGGVADLKNGRVIFIGDPERRIQEDYLRIMRYYRFCSRYGDISDRYHDILHENAKFLPRLSIERIQKEILLILGAEFSLDILKLMMNTGIFREIFKEPNIATFEKVQTFECSLECKLYLLFQLDDLIKTLKLTKLQKKVITDYEKFAEESLVYSLYKKGSDFTRDIIAIRRAKFGEVSEFPRVPDDHIEFPLKFQDLPEGTKFAGRKLRLCEKWWTENNFKKTKDECLEFVRLLTNL